MKCRSVQVLAMSDIEVAGLIFGAFPLVITGLEHYAEGVSTIRVMFSYPSEFRGLSRRLMVEQRIFWNTMELLLLDIVEDRLLIRLLANVGGETWSDPEIDKALQRKLDSSYRVYVEIIKSIHEKLKQFKDRLKLDEVGKV